MTYSRAFAPLALLVLAAGREATAVPQSPLQAVVDWKDGITTSSAITADATDDPLGDRFWVGHGVRRAQIRVEDRVRRFSEEEGSDQDYKSEIIDIEYDELGPVIDHRLFVVTAYQPKTGVPARLQYVDVSIPSAPSEVAVVDLVDTSAEPEPYAISSVRVIPEQKLVLAVGHVVRGSPYLEEPLLMLFRYGQPSPTEPDQLVKLAESRPGQFVMPCNHQGDHVVIRADTAYVRQIGSDTVALVTVNFAPHGKPLPRGVGVCVIDADAALEQDRLIWRTTPQHFIDPASLDFGCGVPQPSGYAFTVAVNDIDFVDVEGPNESVQHFAYMACGSKWQVREYDITNILGSTGFPTPRTIALPWGVGPNDSDDLLWIAARHDPAKNIDLLYVAGRLHMFCAHRTLVPASYAHTLHWLGGVNPEGHVVLEDTPLTAGDREHVWTVAAETSLPWSIWDMTDRFHNPAVEPPQLLETHYAPGGCDGAVAIPELDSIYVPSFNGIVRYDAGQMLSNGTPFAQPVYPSYRPSMVPGSGSHVVEQIDTIRYAANDHRLYTANGQGDLLEWKIDATTKRPGVPTLIDLDWGVSWGPSYGNRATAGWSEHADRPFVLLDHFATDSQPPYEVRVGRYWPPYGGQGAVWQVLDLTATADPSNKLQHYVKDVAISGDWGLVAMHNGVVVLDLGSASDPMGFSAVDTFYTVPTQHQPDRLINGTGYPDVEGVAGIPGTIVVSAGRPSDAGAALAVLAQDESTGVITHVDYIVWDGNGVDGIPGTDFFKPGPLRFFEVEPGEYRLYAGCNYTGAVLEFPVHQDPYGTWLDNPQVWHDGTHPNAVSDIRAYDVGHESGLPLLLVSRYRQTIAVLAASGMLPEEP